MNPTHILYMEDDAGLALLFKKKLERQGFIVDTACDGEEGLRQYVPGLHNVIAVDQNMPNLSGLEVIKTLSAYSPVPPIIMVTGAGDEHVAVEAMKLGAQDYIVKDTGNHYLELMPAVVERVVYQQMLIDEKNRTAEILHQSEERYRSLVELSPDGIAVFVADRFVYLNNSARALLGMRLTDELNSLVLKDLTTPDCYETFKIGLRRTLEHGEGIPSLQGELLRLNGEILTVEIRATPIIFEGSPAAQLIIRDITELKRIEETQRESERLRIALEKEKELNQLRTKLMVTISHEFRTPLTIAYSATELLEHYFERMSAEQRTKSLRNIQQQIHKLTRMMEDVSFITESTFEHLTLDREWVDLCQFCTLVIQDIQSTDEIPRSIVLEGDQAIPPVWLDARRIRYVLSNLISNAMKYSEEDSTIYLEMGQHEGRIYLRVTDEGIGIPTEELGRIFDAFYRGQNIGTVSGTGLGLTIVKEIVEMHGGSINVESKLDKGTCVTVLLPTAE